MIEKEIEGTKRHETTDDWRTWLGTFFPHVCTAPFAARHVRLWDWFDSLEDGEYSRPRVEVWPRGGGKSSTGELGCARLGAKLTRRYVLYVCDTQDQADKHVQSIASLFETLGTQPILNKQGRIRSWRRDQLRTAHGFNVSGFGLEGALRGIKLDQYRPDLILFDDIDDLTDSELTVKRKIKAITQGILPAGSPDCAVLVLQNLVHEDGIVAQIVDRRADFLRDRLPCAVEPAVIGLETVEETQPDGEILTRIVGGEATWGGQSLAICEQQINTWGWRSFDIEAQHNVKRTKGDFFRTDLIKDAAILPTDVSYLTLSVYQAADLAISLKTTADFTTIATIGVDSSQNLYILGMFRAHVDFNDTLDAFRDEFQYWTRPADRIAGGNKPRTFCIETVAYQASAFEEGGRRYMLPFVEIKPSKDKVTRATLLQTRMAMGKVYADKNAAWWPELLKEMIHFPDGKHDDQIDSLANALEQHPVGEEMSEAVRPAPWSAEEFREADERKAIADGRARMRY